MGNVDTEQELLATVGEHLVSLGLTLDARTWVERAEDGVDGWLTVGWQGQTHDYRVAIRPSLRPATAAPVLAELSSQSPMLLVTHSMTGRLAELARSFGLDYVDSAGNAHLRSPHFLIDVQGKRAPRREPADPRSFTKTDLRVVLALIADPDLIGASARELGFRTGVSHGAANLAVGKLRSAGFLTSERLRRGAMLIEAWTQAYLARSGAHRQSRVLYVDEGVDIVERLAGIEGVQLGGELAAERLDWPIRSTSAIVYTDTLAPVARVLRGSSVPGGTPVELRSPVLAPSDNPQGLAASILIRADMLASNDARQIEIAQEALRRDQNLRHLGETP